MRILLSLSLFSACFVSLAQTYEVQEVEILSEAKPIEGLNTKNAEFAPMVFDNIMYFTSSREFDMFNLGENNWKKGGYLNVFAAPIKGEISEASKFKNAELVGEQIKSDNHTGPMCLSVTGDTLFFTQVTPVKAGGKKGKYRPQLFMAVKSGGTWKDVQPMPFNNVEHSLGHPYFDSYSGRLYFAADFKDSKGGKDIYYAELTESGWSQPVNMAKINTEANELFPYLIDGTFFFSSDRAGGVGGLDIYWRILDQPNDKPELVTGLNSEFDDFGIYVFPGMKKGFFSTNRSGNDDIYYLTMEKRVTIKNELAGKFTYRNLGTEGSNLKVIALGEDDEFLYETMTDNKGEFIFDNIDYDGKYSLKIVSDDEMELFIYDKDGNIVANLLTDEAGDFSYKKLNYAHTGTVSLIPDDMIDFELNQGHLSGQFVYEKLPGVYPNNLKVILTNEDGIEMMSTFTDEKGNFDFHKLSMSENYILKVPENDDDLVLLIFDKKGNVVAQLKHNDEGAYVYRRLDPQYSNSLSVIEESEDMFTLETQTISGYFEYKNLKGDFGDGLTVYAFDEDGILLSTTKTDENGQFRFRNLPVQDNLLFKMDESEMDMVLDDFTLYIYDRYGKKIAQLKRGQNGFFIYKPLGFDTAHNLTHENDSLEFSLSIKTDYDIVTVYFDSNQSQVKSSDMGELNKLYKLLKSNPALKMEINAYADARSSDEYNLILSQKRGDWIVEYMVKKGIGKSRFIVNAYGETKLVDAEDHAKNRRAEIRIYQ